jgi:hypothetical protein
MDDDLEVEWSSKLKKIIYVQRMCTFVLYKIKKSMNL